MGTCFRCGTYGHISKTCNGPITQCFIPTCDFPNHNIRGHKVKQAVESNICSDHKKANITTPVIPTSPSPQGKNGDKAKPKFFSQIRENYKLMNPKTPQRETESKIEIGKQLDTEKLSKSRKRNKKRKKVLCVDTAL